MASRVLQVISTQTLDPQGAGEGQEEVEGRDGDPDLEGEIGGRHELQPLKGHLRYGDDRDDGGVLDRRDKLARPRVILMFTKGMVSSFNYWCFLRRRNSAKVSRSGTLTFRVLKSSGMGRRPRVLQAATAVWM